MTTPQIEITDSAAAKVADLIANEKGATPDQLSLRISVSGGGLFGIPISFYFGRCKNS